jgi:hypothetical protein
MSDRTGDLAAVVTLISGVVDSVIVGVDVDALAAVGDEFTAGNGSKAEYQILADGDVDVLPGDRAAVLRVLQSIAGQRPPEVAR